MDTLQTVNLGPIAAELGLNVSQVNSVVALADEGNTVPFITRYRKERTGNLDEEQIRGVLSRVAAARQLAERAATILRLIETQGKLTPELRRAIEAADSLKRLEDLYLPYKPKKRTRAAMARERGLGPLAERVWNQAADLTDLESAAQAFINPEQELPTAADVLQGTADILAERISEDAEVRTLARRQAWRSGKLTSVAAGAATAEAQAYRNYFDHTESVGKIPPHRVLALNRGESEGALRVKFEWDASHTLQEMARHLKLSEHRFREFLSRCATDALDRLIQPSLEREVRRELTEKAETHAVTVFARNLRNLLLQPPLQGERVLAIDPGFRTGCKVAALDETGKRIATDVIYITGPTEKRAATKAKLTELLQTHRCGLVAIGNGTACRETEELVAETIAELAPNTRYVIVNEAGASIYSTSPVAREEFPDDDATVRGTISIGRRLQDPLSELVKIEPQHIGVGLYQHDVNEKQLQESLDQVVESCVNYVGVDLNTASASLLGYVSGLNQLTAKRVVDWRGEHGPYRSRAELLEVPGIGQSTFTQAAGFLKIRDSQEPLDSTWIHPESYPIARKILAKLSATENSESHAALAGDVRERIAALDPEALSRELNVGLPTLRDILDALARPGRDPRSDLPGPIFRQGILNLDDLQPEMELRGTVLNVVDFGAFVDIGLKDSGLVHVSQLSAQFIRSPHDVVSVGDVVTVWVLGVDLERKRVSLTMINPDQPTENVARDRPQEQTPPSPHLLPKQAAPRTPAVQPRPVTAVTDSGDEALRSFGQLKQFWNERHG